MERNGCSTAICMAELHVGTLLPNDCEPQRREKRGDFPRLQRGQLAQLRYLDGLHSDKLGLKARLAILKKHAHHFLKVALELIEGLALAVSTGPPGYLANEQPGVGITLNDEVEATH